MVPIRAWSAASISVFSLLCLLLLTNVVKVAYNWGPLVLISELQNRTSFGAPQSPVNSHETVYSGDAQADRTVARRNLGDSKHTGTKSSQGRGAAKQAPDSASKLEDLEKKLHAENMRHKAVVEALERQMDHLKEIDGTEEEEVQLRQRGHGNTQWTIFSIVCAVIIACCCLACQGGCIVVTAVGCLSDLCNPSALKTFVYAPIDKKDLVPHTIRRELRLMMLLPLIPWLAFQETTCVDGPPNWIYFVYIPFLIRAKILEWRLLGDVGKSSAVVSLAFVLSALEHVDFFTDGVFPIQAIKCDPEVTELFVHSFSHSKVSVLAPIVQSLHFWGMCLILLSACIFAQQVTGRFVFSIGPSVGGEELRLACEADVAGFGALASHFDDIASKNTQGYAPIFVVFAKTLLESCLQLLLQSSYFALVFARTTESARAKLLFSICAGLCSALYKAFCQVLAARSFDDCVSRIFPSVNAVFIMAVVVWVVAKLYYVFHCSSHIWNLTLGCVSM